MPKRLVIVESPTKAKTLKRFLGAEFLVESSVGHVRDLPASAAEIPEKLKKEPWSRLGVDVENDFHPLYVIQPDKKKKITELKRLVKQVDEILLATDEDREGEAISWHLLQLLKPKVPMKRMVFHEITKTAILHSLSNTREIDGNLVDAQEARRIIDRLYGYEVSPILWRKIARGLSAGRVQSVAIRMLVEREEARIRFTPACFWDLSAVFATAEGKSFPARLYSIGGQRLASGKDFNPDTGTLARTGVVQLDQADAETLRGGLGQADFAVSAVEEKPFTKSPAPPFTTSTLQQESNRKLRFDARRTMRAAQRLYENGFITYMRTDSVALSQEAIALTRRAVEQLYGSDFLPETPRTYRTKVKNAQEAHEAIRPTGEEIRSSAEVRNAVGPDEARVYDLIWKRTVACQMKPARGRRMIVRVGAQVENREVMFQATGNVIDFPGFLRAYVEGSDDPDAALADRETILPPVTTGQAVSAEELAIEEHVTSPPPRLTEASLVKTLEESGVGRPSTYASIIETILRREYTFKRGTTLIPTFTAFAVVRLMKENLTHLIDVTFTAQMEDRLDSIARGERESLPYLKEFYYGNGSPGLRPLLDQKAEDIDPRQICAFPLGRDAENSEVVVRVGRYGPYLQREGDDTTAPVPDQTPPDELTLARALEMLAAVVQGESPIAAHPETGENIFIKNGRFGPYVQLGDPDPDKKVKAKMVSLLPGMTPETITVQQALDLLSLPRTLGQNPEGLDVVAHFGRYGAYIKCGAETRSLSVEDNVLSIALPRALELLAQEKRGGKFARRAEPLKVFEKVEALDGVDVKILKGRYGPYVSDGSVNASLPKDIEDPTSLSIEQALELLARQRDKKPRKKVAKKKATRKKATKKKATRKKTTTKKKAATKRKA